MSLNDGRRCLICRAHNQTLYWHYDTKKGEKWVFCNKCDRGYSIYQYCKIAGITLKDLLNNSYNLEETEERDNTISRLEWPEYFISLLSPNAQDGLTYLTKERKIDLKEADLYYDSVRHGIVFPYYFEKTFAGAQIRYLKPKIKEGKEQKIDTLTGTRLGLLFGMWNQSPFPIEVKAVGVCEGYINALSLQQSFNEMYGGIRKCPWRFICMSGSGGSKYQIEKLIQLKEAGYKVLGALDSDEAGIKGLAKLKEHGAITHYSLTEDSDKDWNDILREPNSNLREIFLANSTKV